MSQPGNDFRWFLRAAMLLGLTLVAAGGGPLVLADAPGPDDWPWWRGPNRNAIANPQKIPTTWSDTKNVVWKTLVPGRGHGSPIVVGSRIFLESADEEKKTQFVLCLDRKTGKQLWQKELHAGGFDGRFHKKNTRASSTLACDGERVFAPFYNAGLLWLTALDLDGKQVWQQKLGNFVSHWGYSASPCIYQQLVIVAGDHKGEGGGYLVALDRATGVEKWRTPRPADPTYASPIVLNVGGKDQLLIAGSNLVNSYDPLTGKQLWSTKGTSQECVSTVVTEGDLVFACGGFPAKETLCIKGDGSGKVVWRVNVGDFVPSLIVHKGYLYAVLDNGAAYCWQADTGKEMWKDRLPGGYSASPTLVGDNLVISNEAGKTYVYKASPQKLEIVAENQLGQGIFASPVICGGRIYLRVATQAGAKWEEMLYCIGE